MYRRTYKRFQQAQQGVLTNTNNLKYILRQFVCIPYHRVITQNSELTRFTFRSIYVFQGTSTEVFQFVIFNSRRD